jgi:DNA-binding CsgD family transcriptional regulator
LIITTGCPGEQPCWSGPWTGFSARTGLSEAERRIAALAAHGYTNREIAGRLYVTVSTVEQHLTHAYRKLKVNRRTDLPSLPLTEPVGSTYNNERSRHP